MRTTRRPQEQDHNETDFQISAETKFGLYAIACIQVIDALSTSKSLAENVRREYATAMASSKPTGKGAGGASKGRVPPKKETSDPQEGVRPDERFDRFLHAYARYPHKGAALQTAGLTPEELRERLRDDSEFSRRFMEATEMGADALEDAAIERAVKGWYEPVFNMKVGIQVGEVLKFSDTLLVLLLKGWRKKYRGDDQTGGRGVSEEARREAREIFSEAQALIDADLAKREVTPVAFTVGKSPR